MGCEKQGLVSQLSSWFEDLGVPILALRGYASQSYVDEVRSYVNMSEKLAVLLYAGDFDPSGLDIPRDFLERTDCFREYVPVALTPQQISKYQLPASVAKEADSRITKMREDYGTAVQVEVDALPPDVLRQLFSDAIEQWWDTDAYRECLEQEEADRLELAS